LDRPVVELTSTTPSGHVYQGRDMIGPGHQVDGLDLLCAVGQVERSREVVQDCVPAVEVACEETVPGGMPGDVLMKQAAQALKVSLGEALKSRLRDLEVSGLHARHSPARPPPTSPAHSFRFTYENQRHTAIDAVARAVPHGDPLPAI